MRSPLIGGYPGPENLECCFQKPRSGSAGVKLAWAMPDEAELPTAGVAVFRGIGGASPNTASPPTTTMHRIPTVTEAVIRGMV